MTRKTMILIGMVIGSLAGSYVTALFGTEGFSFSSLLGSAAGGILGIFLAFRLTR